MHELSFKKRPRVMPAIKEAFGFAPKIDNQLIALTSRFFISKGVFLRDNGKTW